MLVINLTDKKNLDTIVNVFGQDEKVIAKEDLLKIVAEKPNNGEIEAGKEKVRTLGESIKKRGRPSKNIDYNEDSNSPPLKGDKKYDNSVHKTLNNSKNNGKENFSSPQLKVLNKSVQISSKIESAKFIEKIQPTKVSSKNAFHKRSRSLGHVVPNFSSPQPNINKENKKSKLTFSNPKIRTNIIKEHKNLRQTGFIKKSSFAPKQLSNNKNSENNPKVPSINGKIQGKVSKCYYKNKTFPLHSLKKAFVKLDKSEIRASKFNCGAEKIDQNKSEAPSNPSKNKDIIVIEDDSTDSPQVSNTNLIDLDTSLNNGLLQKIMKSNNITFVKNPHGGIKDSESDLEIIKTVHKVQRNANPLKKETPAYILPKENTNNVESEYCTFCILCDKSYTHDDLTKKMFLRKHMSEKHDARISNGTLNKSLNVESEKQTPKAGSEKQIPKAGSEKQTPKAGSEKETPKAGSEKQMPKAGSEKQMPKAGSEKQMPKAGSEKQTPKAGSEKQMPKATSERKTYYKKASLNSTVPIIKVGLQNEKMDSVEKSTLEQKAVKTEVKKTKLGKERKRKDPVKHVANKRKTIANIEVTSSKNEGSPAQAKKIKPDLESEKNMENMGPSVKSIKTESLPAPTQNPKVVNKRKRRPSEILNFKLDTQKEPASLILPTVKFESLTLQTPKPLLQTINPKTTSEREKFNKMSTDLIFQSLGDQVVIERKKKNPENSFPSASTSSAIQQNTNLHSTESLLAETSQSMIQETQKILKYSDELIEEYNMSVNNTPPNLVKPEITSEGLGKVSDYFKQNPNLIQPVGNQFSQFCSVDESLPKGWKVRIVKSGSRIEKEFLSPEDLVLKSRKAVEEYINILSHY